MSTRTTEATPAAKSDEARSALSVCIFDTRTNLLLIDGWHLGRAPAPLVSVYDHEGTHLGDAQARVPRPDVHRKFAAGTEQPWFATSPENIGFRYHGIVSARPRSIEVRFADSDGNVYSSVTTRRMRLFDSAAVRSAYGYSNVVVESDDQLFDVEVGDIAFKISFPVKKGNHLTRFQAARVDGTFEPETTTILRSIVEPGDTVVEIGACFGYFTHILSKLVGPHGRVVSLEGLGDLARRIEKNLAINGATNVEIHHALAVLDPGERRDPADINPASVRLQRSKPASHLAVWNDQSYDEDEIVRIQLSTMFEERDIRPDLLFMDIEGYEVDVIEDIFANYVGRFRHRPKILFERHERQYLKGRGLEQIYALARRASYRIIEYSGQTLLKPRTLVDRVRQRTPRTRTLD